MSVDSSDKWRYTLYTTAVLLLLFNPWSYKLVHSWLSGIMGPIANSGGCPTMTGVLVHAFVFTLVVRYMMDMKI